jgi:predicted phosphoribosyltransferase
LRFEEPVVVAIAPAGVPVALEVAVAFGAPLGTVVIEPIEPRRGYAVGAATGIGPAVVDPARAVALGIDRWRLEAMVLAASSNARDRTERYASGPALSGRVVVLVDDGTRHGLSLVAAARALRRFGPVRIVFATPVWTTGIASLLRSEVDDAIHVVEAIDLRCPYGRYEDSRAVTDGDAQAFLREGAGRLESAWAS